MKKIAKVLGILALIEISDIAAKAQMIAWTKNVDEGVADAIIENFNNETGYLKVKAKLILRLTTFGTGVTK